MCKDAECTFTFGIGCDDTVTPFYTNYNLVSTSRKLHDLGSTSLSYQRKVDGTYDYADPTQGEANVFPFLLFSSTKFTPQEAGSDTYTIPADTTIDTRGYLLVCVTEFDIGATDTITLLDNNGAEVSTSGQIGGDSP